VTGRLASSTRTCRTFPCAPPRDGGFREAFIAPPGSKIMSADYSQIELRIMAHLSADKSLLDAFSKAEDVHRHTASESLRTRRSTRCRASSGATRR
jgi:DNA polymerase-1